MNQPTEQQGSKSFKIDPIEFKNKKEYNDFIKQKKMDQEEPKTSEIIKDKFIKSKNDQEQGYDKFLQAEFKKLALPNDQKLEKLKLVYIDKEFEDQNTQQLQKQKIQKINFQCSTIIEDPQDQIDEDIKQLQTRNTSIKIQEQNIQTDTYNDFQCKRNKEQYRFHGNQMEQPQELSQQLQKQRQNVDQSFQNSSEKQQQNEQQHLKQQQLYSQSIKLNFRGKIEKYERYDEIRNEEGKLKMKLSRQELILHENSVIQQVIKKEKFEQDYQFSLDMENRKHEIHESKYPLIRYNQQIGLNDRNILLNQNNFLTSSIINAYANYLQVKDEDYYFSLNKNERIKHKRLIIFNSDFLTNCNLDDYKLGNYQNEKSQFLLLQYLQEFKVIQYQFWLIYKKIAFIVNSKNIHWYLAVLDYQDGCIKIYDSMPKYPYYYNSLNTLLSSLFSTLSQQNLKFEIFVCPTWMKQQDHYSCGYHTCIALEQLSQYIANTQCLTLEEIKKILQQLLLKEENEQNQHLNE